MELDNKVAVVTGAATLMGRAVVDMFVAERREGRPRGHCRRGR